LAYVAEKRRVIISEMIRVADARSTRSLNRRSVDGVFSNSMKKVRADFYMSLDRRHKNV
jgi:hypothetical protein